LPALILRILIVWSSSEQLKKPDYDKEKIIELSQKIREQTHRITKIVRGLKTFSRDSTHEQFQMTSLSQILDDSLVLCQERFKNHGIHLHIPALSEELKIECQPVAISQVLINLFNNAHDAIINLEEKWVRIDIEDFNEHVLIRILDSGEGIPQEIQNKILEPFFTTKGVSGGTGLGLSISKGLIEKHHGLFSIETNCPNTCFTIQLPKKQPFSTVTKKEEAA